jgi:hypothetical protein
MGKWLRTPLSLLERGKGLVGGEIIFTELLQVAANQ